YDAARKAIHRRIRLHDFAQALALMVRIGVEAEKRDHHPEWTNVYNRLDIWLTTHDAGGHDHPASGGLEGYCLLVKADIGHDPGHVEIGPYGTEKAVGGQGDGHAAGFAAPAQAPGPYVDIVVALGPKTDRSVRQVGLVQHHIGGNTRVGSALHGIISAARRDPLPHLAPQPGDPHRHPHLPRQPHTRHHHYPA
ncbi:hypothetical protein E4T56_gene6188, partial [Termitomyces sp. T112]